jgi:fructose-bisphosphate aldolase, class II
VADTADLEGMMTTAQQVNDFMATGVDFLAPAFGNVHGEYAARGPVLDYERLDMVARQVRSHNKGVRVVLHGTNDFPEDVMQKCIAGGVSKINDNKLVLDEYLVFRKEASSGLALTTLVERGIAAIQTLVEWQMDVCGSTG